MSKVSRKVETLPGGLVAARQVKPAGLLSAYRLPVFINRPPFAPLSR